MLHARNMYDACMMQRGSMDAVRLAWQHFTWHIAADSFVVTSMSTFVQSSFAAQQLYTLWPMMKRSCFPAMLPLKYTTLLETKDFGLSKIKSYELISQAIAAWVSSQA